MAIRVDSNKIREKHLYKDEIVDSDGKKYNIKLTLKQLRDAVTVTATEGPVAGDAYLQEVLDIPIELDAQTLSTITGNALKQFYGKTPR